MAPRQLAAHRSLRILTSSSNSTVETLPPPFPPHPSAPAAQQQQQPPTASSAQLVGFTSIFLLLAFVCVGVCHRVYFSTTQGERRRRELQAAAAARADQERQRNPNVVPLPAELQEALPRVMFTAAESKLHDLTCPICIVEYEEHEELLTLPCSHSFHLECVTLWFQTHSTCPTCRFSLLPGAEETKVETGEQEQETSGGAGGNSEQSENDVQTAQREETQNGGHLHSAQ